MAFVRAVYRFTGVSYGGASPFRSFLLNRISSEHVVVGEQLNVCMFRFDRRNNVTFRLRVCFSLYSPYTRFAADNARFGRYDE